MFKFSFLRWISAKIRNIGRATCGGTAHSVTMTVYDNGRLVVCREIDAYETNEGHADDFYIVGRMNAYTSELYGNMRRVEKERVRMAKKRKSQWLKKV